MWQQQQKQSASDGELQQESEAFAGLDRAVSIARMSKAAHSSSASAAMRQRLVLDGKSRNMQAGEDHDTSGRAFGRSVSAASWGGERPVWWSIMRLVPALLARSRGTGSRIDVFDDDFNGPWARDSCMLSKGE